MMAEKINLPENIRYFRLAKGSTQDALAKKVGITTPYMYTLEHKHREISLFLALRLAEALEITLDDLIFGPKNKKKIKQSNNNAKSK